MLEELLLPCLVHVATLDGNLGEDESVVIQCVFEEQTGRAAGEDSLFAEAQLSMLEGFSLEGLLQEAGPGPAEA